MADDEGKAYLQIEVSPLIHDKNEVRLELDQEAKLFLIPIKYDTTASTLWFSVDGLRPGFPYTGARLRLTEGGEILDVEPFVVPAPKFLTVQFAEGDQSGKLLLNVDLPPDLPKEVTQLTLSVGSGKQLSTSSIERDKKKAVFEFVDLGVHSEAQLSWSGGKKSWPVAPFQVPLYPREPPRQLLPWLAVVLVALLWAFTSTPAGRVVYSYLRRSRSRNGSETGESNSTEADDATGNASSKLSVVFDELMEKATLTVRALQEVPALIARLASKQEGGGQGVTRPLSVGSKPPVSLKSDNELDTLRQVIENHWRANSSLDRLEAIARERSLQLYEWAHFDEILRKLAADAVDLRFPQWRPGARGPVFLGWRKSMGEPLYIVPVSSGVFGSDQGLSALLKLFELRPKPVRKVFQFRAADRPCRLSSQGASYRLSERGVIGTGEGASTFLDFDEGPVTNARDFGSSRPQVDDTTDAHLQQLQGAVREEIRREVRSAFAESRNALMRIEATIQTLRSQQGERQAALGRELREPIQGAIREVLGPLKVALTGQEMGVAGHTQTMDSLEASSLDRGPITEAPSAAAADPLTSSPPTAGEGSPQPLEVPSASDVFSEGDFDWISSVLAQQAISGGRSPRDYVLALAALKTRLQQTSPAVKLAYFRVFSDVSDCVILHEVRPGQTNGELQFRKTDGDWVLLDNSWQVFVGVTEGGEEATPSSIALLFPWSRLEKGAPMAARSLVDTGRSGPLAEFVYCVEPAILEWRAQTGGYSVIKKMVVASFDAPLEKL